ncbi:MAG: S9 family peptidase [Gemmatimonadaceae bacterium]
MRTMAIAPAAAGLLLATIAGAQAAPRRPMNFLDLQEMRSAGGGRGGGGMAISPDRRLAAYTITTPDWYADRHQSDIYVVPLDAGLPGTRQMTFTTNKDEDAPIWTPDGAALVFASNRDAPAAQAAQEQLYLLRLDGGEARRLTDAHGGVGTHEFSPDGHRLAYTAGRDDAAQIWALPADQLTDGTPVQLTHHATGVTWWRFAPDGSTLYFLAPDTTFADERRRTEAHFGVHIQNPVMPRVHLWALDLSSNAERRLTGDSSYSLSDVEISPDGKYIGFRGIRDARWMRGTLEQNDWSDEYLLTVSTGAIERLTNNFEIRESAVSFSPDSRTIALSAPNDWTYSRLSKVYVRPVTGGAWRKLGAAFDGEVTVGFWSDDGGTIYFNDGYRATTQLFALDVRSGAVQPVTNVRATVRAERDEASGVVLLQYADDSTPPSTYTVHAIADAGDRSRWVRLTDVNPQVAGFALGRQEEVTWKSTDGTSVGGVLLYPVGYEAGHHYPLIVAIHGGPAAADVLGFNGGYGSQVYAGAGYAVFMPNYRASTNYGEKFRNEVVGDYFTKGFQDIMTGVDYLIARGIVDSAQMGELGWSAGGHYSDWILTHTNRFKAISSGAGTFNWVSMYGESDTQRLRQWYLGGKLPYDDLAGYTRQSPIAYVRNAHTPTLIHVVEGDPRVPKPQSEELYMALKKLGVPTEFFVYPGNTHGIPAARDRYTKAMAEFWWMEHYVRGKNVSFSWAEILKSLRPADSTAHSGSR